MGAKRVYMCLSVRGAIRNLQGQRGKRSMFNDDNGKPMSKDQALGALMDELVKGRETIPMNSKCGNPCANSDKCKGFDYGEQGGCPGHEVEDEVTQPPAADSQQGEKV
jgi:hypothetical protein